MTLAKHAAVHQGHAVHHAPTSEISAAQGVAIVIGAWAFIIALVVGFIFLVRYSNYKFKRDREKAEQQAHEAHAEMMKALAPWLRDPLPPIATPPGLVLESGEAAYYSGNAQILGLHTQTRRVGGSAGPSFRVAKGLYFHTSTFASQPIRQEYTAVDDRGILTVTSMRVIFIGGKNSLAWPLSKILSMTPFVDGVQVNPENRAAVVFQTGNQVAAIVIHRAREGSLSKSLPATA